jgi:RHS repeat-associated protein
VLQCDRNNGGSNVRFRNSFLLGAVLLVWVNCFAQNPQVTSISPVGGEVGTQVQIYGSGFGTSQGSSSITFFYQVSASVTSWSDGQITATVPSAATTGPVTVTVGGVASNSNIYFTVPAPVVTSVSPTSGIVGTQITIAGSGFQASKGSSYILINGGGASPTISSWSDTQIVATVPAGVTTGPVTVTVNGVASNPNVIFTMPDPIVTSLSPSSGPVGTQVQVNGSGFGTTQGTSTIKINTTSLNVVSWSNTQITAGVPSSSVTGPVQVSIGGVNSNSNIYFTVPPPQITSISPATGPANTQVTINGSGFQATQGSSTVQFNGQTPSVSSWNDSTIVAAVPSGTTTGPVVVTVNAVASNKDVVFKLPGPLVSGVTPGTGPTGSQVVVSGSGFGATQGTSTITFNGVSPTVNSWSDTQIGVTLGPTVTSGPVKVTVSNVVSPGDVNFTVPGPQVTSISPASGVAGSQVTINGSAFQATRGSASYVYFGSTSATVNSWSTTRIVATVPNGVSTGPVYVYVNSIVSNQDVVFTTPDPVITGITPSSGPVGTQIQINGSGFGATQGTSTVTLYPGVNPAVTSWSNTQIVATVPLTARSGVVNVTVGTVSSNSNVFYSVPPPQITSISPSSGVVGTQVTIIGSGFQAAEGGGIVYFGVYSATVVSWSDTQLVVAVPSGATSGPVMMRSNNGNTSNQDLVFTMPNPVIATVSPVGGPVGMQATVSGSGFGAAQGTLTFNGTASTSISSWSDAQVVATVPSGATTGAVKVVNGGVNSNANVSFTVGNVTIDSVSPHGGPTGTQVTINGVGFGATQGTLSFNGTAATSISSWSDSQVVATIPSGATTGAVKVVNGGVSSNTNVVFTVSTVVVNGVSPASGPGGSQVEITGTGFGTTQGTVMLLSGYSFTVVSWTNTQITANAPTTATWGGVRVTAGGVNSNTDIVFTVTGPIITGVSPSSGPVGTPVQVNGSGFGATQGTISFSGDSASVTSWSNTQIAATVPTGATTGAVSVVANGVASNNNIYFTVPGPQVTGISPTSGVVGTQVTITGSGFQANQNGGSVSFNGGGSPIVTWSDTQIAATVASTATTGPVMVTVNSLNSNKDVLFTMPSPQITGISPSSGPVGTQVQINGSGFGATQGTSTLTFYGSSSAPIVSWSNTQITTTVPTTARSGSVKVTEGGVSSNANIDFTVPPPHVAGVSPSSGPGGTQITVTGSGFQATEASNSLYIDNQYSPLVTYSSWSDSQIVATIPVGAVTGSILASINDVWSNADVLFTLPNPQVTGISPSSGPVGTQILINGSGFGATQGTSTLTMGPNVTVAATSWSDTQIAATVPATVTTAPVKVTEGGVSSNTNIYFTLPAPHVASVSPGSGVVSTQVTITGTGFQASQGSGSVSFCGPPLNNSINATINSWSNTQIVATVPANAITGPVTVYVNSVGSNQDVEFVLPNPQVATLAPTSGPVGTQVQINGSGFGATQGTSTVVFNRIYSALAAGIVSWSDAQIVAVAPNNATTGPVTVTTGGVTSNANIDFTVPAPQITSLTPNIGGVANPVTIAGSGFQAAQGSGSVSFNGVPGTVSSWSDTQIVVIVPNNAATGPVRAFASNNQASNPANYTVPNLSVGTVSPTSGPVGTQVTVTGAGFGATQGTSTLTFNGQQPSSLTSWSNTQIVATVPVTAATGPALVNVNNINSNNNVIFTVPPPSIASYTPEGGVAGTSVTLTGSGFQANQRNSTVTFNGVPGTVTSWSATQIVTSVPTTATTGPLQVNVNGASNGTSTTFEVPNPVITSVSPSDVPIGGTFTITGSGFGPSNQIGNGVTSTYVGFPEMNGTELGIYSWSNTEIVAQAGAAATGNLTVVKFNATSNAVPFTVEGLPTVTGISPTVGVVGTSVTLTGTGFGPQQGNSSVLFFGGATAAVSSWSDTEIVATVPPGTASGPVGVTVDSVVGPAVSFTLNATVQVTDSLGNVSSYTSQMVGGAWLGLSATGSGCSSCTVRGTISSTLDSLGNLLTTTDELGHVTTFTYDANDNMASQSQQLDSNTTVATSYTYNSFGEPLTVTDPLGNVTTNTYDANGNLLTVTSPAPNGSTAASVTQFAYDIKGDLTQITDPLGNLTTLTYNPVGLIATIKDAQSNVTTYAYDQRGNRTSITDALSNVTAFTYDLGNRLTNITYPDQSTMGFGYDSRGRRTSVTDQNGKVTSYAYDDADRPTSVTDAANNVTQYGYDTENNLTSITDAAGHTTSFTYDPFGRVTQTSFPSTLAESYSYDSVGNMTSKTDRKGNSILYVYDALNRLVHKGYPDSTGVDYVYDLAGKIRQVTDPTGTYAMAYDNMGRLIGTTTTYSFLPSVPFANTYAYDANSNRTSLTLPDASTDTYQYDTLNRVTKITDSLTGQFTFGYDGLSRRTSLTRPNGVNTSYGYDSLSRLLSVLHQAGANTLDGAAYSYDLAGNRTAKTNKLNNITEQYTYDPLYQLTQVVQGATTSESYSYDDVGNRLSSQGMGSYSYNVSNELTATSASSFTYDANGNTLSKTDSTGTRNYAWDFENRLTSAALPGSGGTVTFKYDPFGRRIQKSFTQNSTSTTTNYLYDGINVSEEVDGSGNEVAQYEQGPGIDVPLSEHRSGTTGYYEQDGLSSVTSLSGSTGTLSNTYTYDSFGNLEASTGSLGNPFQFTGRDFDPETGLRYYRARYYDPQVGRFIGEDTIGFDGGVNFYPYVDNSPTNFTDPTGWQALQNPQPNPEPNPPPGPQLVPNPQPGNPQPENPGVGNNPWGDILQGIGFCLRMPWACFAAGALTLDPNTGTWQNSNEAKFEFECAKKTKWRCRVRCAVIRLKDNSAVGYVEADGYGPTEADAYQAAQNLLQNSTAQGFRTKHCHVVGKCVKNN